MRSIKCSNNIVKYRSDWPSGGPRGGHVGVMLGSSWHLKGILTPLIIILATKVNLRGGEVYFLGGGEGPGRPLGRGFRGGESVHKGIKPDISTRPRPKAWRIFNIKHVVLPHIPKRKNQTTTVWKVCQKRKGA